MTEIQFDDLNAGDRVRVFIKPGSDGIASEVDGEFAGFTKCMGFQAIQINWQSVYPGFDERKTFINTREIEKVLRLGR